MWLIIGFIAQGLFASRFLVQWLVSEKQKKSIIPVQFWYLSLGGGIMLLAYAIHRQDPVFILGQSARALIYTRNLMLIYKSKKEAKKALLERQNKNLSTPEV